MGQLQLACVGETVADFRMEPGWYRVRSFHGRLDTIDESEQEGNDHYLAVLWPALPAELRVIEQTPKVPAPNRSLRRGRMIGWKGRSV